MEGYVRALRKAILTVCSQAPVNDSMRDLCVDLLSEIGVPRPEAEKLASGRTAVIRGAVPEPLEPIVVRCQRGGKNFLVLAPDASSTDEIVWILSFAKKAFDSGGPYPLFGVEGQVECTAPNGMEISLTNNIGESLFSVIIKSLELATRHAHARYRKPSGRRTEPKKVFIVAPGVGPLGTHLLAAAAAITLYLMGRKAEVTLVTCPWVTDTVKSVIGQEICRGDMRECVFTARGVAAALRKWSESIDVALDYYTITGGITHDEVIIAMGVAEDLAVENQPEVREHDAGSE